MTNQYQKKHLKIAALCFGFVFVLALGAIAQGPGAPGSDPDNTGVEVPIDGGISLAVAGAAAYGVYRLKKANRKKQDEA